MAAAEAGRKAAVVVGISGASSSGKTTLSRLLRDIFPNAFVLHEDDFYKPEAELPKKGDLLDWDCAEALSIPDMVTSLHHIQQHGTFPPGFDSKEDRNAVSGCPVPDDVILALRARVSEWTAPGQPGHGILPTTASPTALRLAILDGFLLYSPSMAAIQEHLDIKFFLRVGYADAKARREARDRYATIEGWWQDPPGYVDKVVWPNYVGDHAWLFEGGDVEGRFREDVIKKLNIICQMDWEEDVTMEGTLTWLVESLMRELEGFASKQSS